MTKQELKLLNSKTPEEYIDNSVKTKLTPGKKAQITKLWLEKNKKYTIEDIQYARNRHPYWKKKKMEGSQERNFVRQQEHNYTTSRSLEWDDKTIQKFLEMNQKDKQGKYIYKDYQLAQHFETTIPSIQHYRRKFNMIVTILAKKKEKLTSKRVIELIRNSEQVLRRLVKGNSSTKTAGKKKTAAKSKKK